MSITTPFLVLAGNEWPHWHVDVQPWHDGSLATYTSDLTPWRQITSFVGPSEARPESYVEPRFEYAALIVQPQVPPQQPPVPAPVPEPGTGTALLLAIAAGLVVRSVGVK